ncbi:MAG: hypothetical protein AAF763_15690 [Pseudomonadota bacterium]
MRQRTFLAPPTTAANAEPAWKTALALCETLEEEANAVPLTDEALAPVMERLHRAEDVLVETLKDADAVPRPVLHYLARSEALPPNSALAEKLVGC